MNLENVEFVWASDFIERFSDKYWFNVLQISLRNSIARIKRCGQIMGRTASDELMSSQILYPIMQANDVFMLKCDMTSLGLDQRKVNVLAREFCKPANNINGALDHLMTKGKMNKPVVLSHHMLGKCSSAKRENFHHIPQIQRESLYSYRILFTSLPNVVEYNEILTLEHRYFSRVKRPLRENACDNEE